MKYVLASKSPRRKELMEEISADFIVDVSNVEEVIDPNKSPKEIVISLARQKGEIVHQRHPDDVTISADTIVVFNDEIIGKPKDEEDAKRILRELSGNKHFVLTGYAIFYQDKVIDGVCETKVYFNKLSEKLIDDYVASKSPLDKAGAYGVQDNPNFPIINFIIGDLNNVIGFPIYDIKSALKEHHLL